MTPKHVAATMAALAVAATPPHLRGQQSIALSASPVPTPAAGAAPQGAAAPARLNWDEIVTAMNTANGFSHPGPCPDPRLVALLAGEGAR